MINRKKRASELYAGAYALNALNEDERREYESVLARSETLRAESTELQDTAVLLGLATDPIEPPDFLRTRIMAQIENTPQLAPEAAEDQHAAVSKRSFSLRALVPTGFAVLAATAALAIVVPLSNPSPAAPQPNTAAAISKAHDVRSAQVQAGLANRVDVVWSADMQEAAVKVDDSNLVEGNSYQLWYMDKKGNARSGGLIQRGQGGWKVLSGKMHEGDVIGMTVEPAWGSSHPTTRPLFALST